MKNRLERIRQINEEWLEGADERNQRQLAVENTMEYQCKKNTIDGKICRFIKKYAESQDPPLHAGFEWNGVVSWFTVGDESVSMQAGRFLDGSGRLTIQKSELEKNKWWYDALFNNSEMNVPAENIDIHDDVTEKKKRKEVDEKEELRAKQQDQKMVSQIKQEISKDAPQEIERKFLVRSLPKDLDQYESDDVLQGYVSIIPDGSEIRIRHVGEKFFQTEKSHGGKIRTENEVEITKEQFQELWNRTEGRRVEKKRYKIPQGNGMLELDIYQGKLNGLLSVEIEFQNRQESEEFIPPKWFGEEVTENQEYKNRNLATEGIPQEY